jgi:hypothetical protein
LLRSARLVGFARFLSAAQRNLGRILLNCVEQEEGTARCKTWHP